MPQSRHALLLGNAETLPADFLKQLAARTDFVLVTDGAADRALQCGLIPDAVIGDLDSATPQAKKQLPHIPWIFVSNQNNTDLEKALDWLVTEKFTHVTLGGFFGGRLDFTLGNWLSLTPYTQKLQLTCVGPDWMLAAVTKKLTVTCQPRKRVSLLTTTRCSGICTTGLKYPLKNACLSNTQPGRFISNQTTGKRWTVSIEKGVLWVYCEL